MRYSAIIRIIIVTVIFISVGWFCSAQVYEVDYLIGNYIRAKRTDGDGREWIVKIPNGTKINVDRRVVADDSTDCRDIMASFSYNGKIYTTEARWLRYSDDNPENALDIFADDDFSPTEDFVKERLAFTRFAPLSPKGRFLYGLTLPLIQFFLMIAAVFLIYRSTVLKSVIPFVFSVFLQVFIVLMMGDDTLWWCLPEYQGLAGAVVGLIPLAVYLTLEMLYILGLWTFAGIKIWPVFVAMLLIYPAITLSYFIAGNVWVGLIAVCVFPLLVNCVTLGKSAFMPTLLMIIGIAGFFVTVSLVFLAGMKIVAGVVGACPVLAVLIAIYVKSRAGFHIHRSNGEWVTPWGTYDTLERAKRAAPKGRH